MPLSARVLTTLQTVKDELGIIDGTKDDLLTRYINAASDHVLNTIDRKLIRGTYTSELYAGDGTLKLYLREWPIVSVESVKIEDQELDTADDDYVLTDRYKEQGYLYRECGWEGRARTMGILTDTAYNESLDNIEVDYTAGYCTPQQVLDDPVTCPERTLPYDIEEVVIGMVTQMFRIKCLGNQGQASYKAGSIQITWKDLMTEHMDVLSYYERTEV